MDGKLNVVLEKVVLCETSEKMKASMANDSEIFSDVFIRGNNVCYIAPQGNSSNARRGLGRRKENRARKDDLEGALTFEPSKKGDPEDQDPT